MRNFHDQSAEHVGTEPTLAKNVTDATFETTVENHVDLQQTALQTEPFIQPTSGTLVSPMQSMQKPGGHVTERIFDGDTSGVGTGNAGTTDVEDDEPSPGGWVHFDIDPNYVKALCRRYENKGISKWDLLNLAVDGVYDTVEEFDPTRNVKFQTYATHKMLRRIRRHFEKRKKEQNYFLEKTNGYGIGRHIEVSARHSVGYSFYRKEPENDAPKIPTDLDEIFLDHILTSVSKVFEGPARVAPCRRMLSFNPLQKRTVSNLRVRQELYLYLHAVVNSVMEKEYADIILLRFGAKCASFTEIGKACGLSRATIRRKFRIACMKLVDKLLKYDTRNLALRAFQVAMTEAKRKYSQQQKQTTIDLIFQAEQV